MSSRKIKAELKKKGIIPDDVYYDHNRDWGGYTVDISYDDFDRLDEIGFKFRSSFDDLKDVLEFIETVPSLKGAVMFEQILKHRPKGATHWDVGTYYKKDGDKWFYWDRLWFRVADISTLNMWMTTLPEEKEPAMSEFKEFKVGDKVIWLVDDPWQWDVNAIHEIKEHSHGQYKVYLGDEFVCWCGDQVFWQEFRHATPDEEKAGHRIDCKSKDV